MHIWTTFTPAKLCWELTSLQTKGKSPSSNWQKNTDLIEESLRKLKKAGISGIRLVIFPSELTGDGKIFNWKPIEKMLDICSKNKLLADLCIGPFQYPHYPGIYLPPELIKKLEPKSEFIDSDPVFKEFGLRFLTEQIQSFRGDERLLGFHFANEWPDKQNVEGKRSLKMAVSEGFMLESAHLIKSLTKKPISLNTNIDIRDQRRITKAFGKLLKILSTQAKLGFDIYPSQDKWKKVPFQKLRGLISDYPNSFKSVQNKFPASEIYFAEVEAQPWGGGQSWYQLIAEEPEPNVKVLNYYNNSLETTFRKHIQGTDCMRVSLWGSDFWLSADMIGIRWPLEQIGKLSNHL